MSDLVTALWVGPGPAELPDKTVLIPGESTYQVPRAQAEASDYWEIPETGPRVETTVAATTSDAKVTAKPAKGGKSTEGAES